MGLLKSIGDILFGKQSEIFDEAGNVIHKHPKKKWDNWQNRYKNEPAYNWRQHQGVGRSGSSPSQNSAAKQSDKKA